MPEFTTPFSFSTKAEALVTSLGKTIDGVTDDIRRGFKEAGVQDDLAFMFYCHELDPGEGDDHDPAESPFLFLMPADDEDTIVVTVGTFSDMGVMDEGEFKGMKIMLPISAESEETLH